MARMYNTGGATSDIDGDGSDQLQDFYYQRKALIDLKKEQYFLPMASEIGMPKNYGKTIKRYHYLPMLDDRNINDQGIDAAGAAISEDEYAVQVPYLACIPANGEPDAGVTLNAYAIGDYVYDETTPFGYSVITTAVAIGGDATGAGGNATSVSEAAIKALIEVDTVGVTATVPTYSATSGLSVDGLFLVYPTEADANKIVSIIGGTVVNQRSGNLYASSKDVGTITGKLPTLSEVGGRVNRVGFKRIQLEGSIEKFGFFDEYTKESVDFDTDSGLKQHINREMLRGASEITEDALQIDLLNSAATIMYAGDATTKATITGETGSVTEIDYADFSAMSIILDNNRTPKDTKMFTGTRMTDTNVIPACRAMFIGSEMIPTIERMTDHFSNEAFIKTAHYGAGTKILNGEIGTVGYFRIIVVPEMMHFAGAGAEATSVNAGYQSSAGRYNVYPLLIVGSESFTTIGFQTSGKNSKFRILHKAPGLATASSHEDPYGEIGFMSIAWWYGFMGLRTERLAIMYSVGRL